MRDLQDYKRGALGNVDKLESIRLELLRFAEQEMNLWEIENSGKND
jgi:hypothetical protein